MASFVVGVDGCRGGWFAVRLAPGGEWSTNVYRDAADLWRDCREAALVLIDIPIGLRDTGRTERLCDLAARKRLGHPRGSSVFPAPCRKALQADGPAQASAINESLTGRKLSLQSRSILRKIREVDDLLRTEPAARGILREVHPEVLFWGLNREVAMGSRKKLRKGFEERRDVLQRSWAPALELIDRGLSTHLRKAVGRDDLLDALAAAITALGDPSDLRTLPENLERDGAGLPMEMVWRAAAVDRGPS